MAYRATVAETLKFKGHKGDEGDAYFARPSAPGPPSMIVLPDELPSCWRIRSWMSQGIV